MKSIENTKVDELLKLYDLPIEELTEMSSKVTRENFADEVEFCSIISAKTGLCSEDCKYCSQSRHYKTNVESHSLVSIEDVKKAALSAKENKATRFCVVVSGRTPDEKDFSSLLKMIETVANIDGLNSCCSLGILDEKQVKQIKDAGVERFNHNLNTCKSYHKEICTTHTYEDRVNTINLIKSYGIEACTGGIIGMGETRRQRAELAAELAELNPKSVPINFLHPVAGTPMETLKEQISEEEILRTICIFRIALPKALIRYAGGRALRFSKEYQLLGIRAGINALLVGNYLTTTGISPNNDIELVHQSGMTVAKV